MSSAFDKSPEQPEDPGREDTAAYGQPVPPQQGYTQPGGYPSGDYGPPPGYGPPAGYRPPPGYGYPPYGFTGPDHPKATTSLVLGILGVVLCQVLAPFALVTGRRTLAEIDASQGRWGGRGAAQAGYVLGIVGTVILGLAVVGVLLYLVLAVLLFAGAATV